MKKFFLGPLLTGEKLYVVDEQRIERPIRPLEFGDAIVLQAFHHIADETFRVHIGNVG